MKIYKLDTNVYCVSKAWKDNEHIGAHIIPAKITGYQNIGGKIHPILKNGIKELSPESNQVFYDLEEAVEKIKSKK